MLKLIQYEKRSQAENYLNSLDFNSTTLVVSDLASKLEYQAEMLQSQGFFLDENIYRASDLWGILFRRYCPNYRIVSESFLLRLIKRALENFKEQLPIPVFSDETLKEYIHYFISVLADQSSQETLKAWVYQEFESGKIPGWYEWYLQSRFIFSVVLEKEKVVVGKWASHWLWKTHQQRAATESSFVGFQLPIVNGSLTFDLGSHLNESEVSLIEEFAKRYDVTVLVPTANEQIKFKGLLRPYESFRTGQASTLPEVVEESSQLKCHRVSGGLAEAKWATAQIRCWLDSGITPSEIMITAPDIEAYWPVLSEFLLKEGIPFQKRIVTRIKSLPEVSKWLSELRLANRELSVYDLENKFYQGDDGYSVRTEKFLAMFANIFSPSDLSRITDVQARQKFIDPSDTFVRNHFLLEAIKFWDSSQADSLETVVREVIKNAHANQVFNWDDWCRYIESICSSKEQEIQSAADVGIAVESLSSATHFRRQYKIFLGCTEESFRRRSKNLISSEEVQKLARQTGIYLEDPEKSHSLFEFHQSMQTSSKAVHLLASMADFDGQLTNPLADWLKWGGFDAEIEAPGMTVWDSVQNQAVKSAADFDLSTAVKFKILDRDLGTFVDDPALPLTEIRTSATGIISYIECPFKYKASHLYRLRTESEIDLDTDFRTIGSFAHSIFESLVKEIDRPWTETEILQLIEKIKDENEIVFASEKSWTMTAKKFLKLSQKFLEYETKRLQDYNVKSLGQEVSFEMKWPEVINGKEVTLRGKLDRVDVNSAGQAYVVDYKRSPASAKNHRSWKEDSGLQMLFYIWVLRQNAIPEIIHPVVGGLYYIFKNLTIKGLYLKDASESFEKLSSAVMAGSDDLNKKIEEFVLTLENCLQQITSGEFSPNPKKPSECKKCDWNRICRSQHLNK